MGKIRDLIEEVIKEFKARNEEGYYSHTIKALEKMKAEFAEPDGPPDIRHDEDDE